MDIFIITSNQDIDGSILPRAANVWLTISPGISAMYLDKKNQSKENYRKILKEISGDCFYINGLFSFNFSILPLFLFKSNAQLNNVVLAPRGMLGKGALSIKPVKKSLFLFLYKMIRLPYQINWHSTSPEESNDIRRSFGNNVRISEITNFPRTIEAVIKTPRVNEQLRLFFYSRISPKKNLLYAIKVLQLIPDLKIRFNIYGPIEDVKYWHSCLDELNRLPANIKAEYKGELNSASLTDALADEEVLFLPTLNENYGHVIVESLLCGCNVIISDQTPWKDLELNSSGIAVDLNRQDLFVNAITYFSNLTEKEIEKQSKLAIDYIIKKLNLEETSRLYKNLFNDCAKN